MRGPWGGTPAPPAGASRSMRSPWRRYRGPPIGSVDGRGRWKSTSAVGRAILMARVSSAPGSGTTSIEGDEGHMKQLTGLDASFLYMETKNTYGHVNGLSIFERPSADFDPYR